MKDSKEASDFDKQIKKDRKKFDELNAVYVTMHSDITALRANLENLGKGPMGVYDYEMDIKYQVIGN
jgi:hypothetical protein